MGLLYIDLFATIEIDAPLGRSAVKFSAVKGTPCVICGNIGVDVLDIYRKAVLHGFTFCATIIFKASIIN